MGIIIANCPLCGDEANVILDRCLFVESSNITNLWKIKCINISCNFETGLFIRQSDAIDRWTDMTESINKYNSKE